MSTRLPNPPEAYFLDFDGVVVESADIKTDAFYALYLPYGIDIAEKAKSHHLQHQGVSRYRKFEEIATLYLGRPCPPDEKENLSRKFSALVLEKILTCPLVDGVINFLEEQQRRDIPVYLFSATPHAELIHITEKRALSRFFREIHGVPQTKVDSGRAMARQYGHTLEEVVFIGDSPSDEDAARILGTPFVGRVSDPAISVFKNSISTIRSFVELP